MKIEQMVRERYAKEVEKELHKRVESCFYMFTRNDGCDCYGLTGSNRKLLAVIVPIDDVSYDIYY